MTWILILTIWAQSSSAGSAMTQVGPFHDNASCKAAAAAWLEANYQKSRLAEYSAICAQTKAAP